MKRTLRLGAKGEEAARHLLDVYTLSTVFEPSLVISPQPRILDELRRRLADTATRLERWEPRHDLVSRVRQLKVEVAESGERPVIWLQQKSFTPQPWRDALSVLNQQREFFRTEAPWMWVLAGPEQLVDLAHRHAMHVLTGVAVRLHVPEEVTHTVSKQPPTVRWLHLSDFHFKELERWERRATLGALLRHAEELKDQDLRPNFVFITGDIAHSGQAKEYDQALRFFTELAKKLELGPARDFFVIPGNHDVDRSKIGPLDSMMFAGLRDEETVEKAFGDPPTMGLLARRLEQFYGFTERFQGAARTWQNDRPWRVDVREVGALRIGVLQLNSAWASGRNGEEGSLLVGEAQLREALLEATDAHVKVALVHHPLSALAEFDRARIEGLLGAPGGVHFLLRGHLHRDRTVTLLSPDGALTELAAGACYVEGGYPKTYQLTELDFTAGEVRVHFFRYSDEGRGFWAPNPGAYEKARDGVWRFPLPSALQLDSAEPETSAPVTAERRATVTARYRAAAAAVHGTVRFVGLADHRPRRTVQVPELFVPLRVQPRGEQDEKKSWTTPELLRHLLRPGRRGQPAARVVVLGGPGSGKTTLCRFAAVAIAGEHTVDGVEVTGEPVPLLVPFREYVRKCSEVGEQSIVDFLTDQARTVLQVPIPDGFVEQALDAGHAVLLLDGLDEVGSAAERAAMGERVLGFCRSYSRVPALVTSRIAGYDDVPLPHSGADGFTHVQLVQFNDQDLETFVRHWYAVQEPDDPVERDRGVSDLLTAIQASPPVRALAYNPLLATLIALVHRHEAHLPGERAALYELCVKTFLETWQAAKRRRLFHDIDLGLQRAYLEAVAYRMQQTRRFTAREVTIERSQLVDTLVEVVVERQGPRTDRDATRRLMERWVEHLEQGTGLLLEQRPGVFAFFHLSLMEYLAACRIEKTSDVLTTIVNCYHDPAWREVCLLAIGRWATAKEFLNQLFTRISKDQRTDHWSFLLLALHEEADFDSTQKSQIISEVGKSLLDTLSYSWKSSQQTFDHLMRLSIRHAGWAKSFLKRTLATAREDELRGVVTLRLEHQEEIVEALAKRPDATLVAGDLLDFWPLHNVGRWAAETVAPDQVCNWALTEAPDELMIARSLWIFSAPDSHRLAAPLLVGLIDSATWWAAKVHTWAEALKDCPRQGRCGLPPAIVLRPGDLILSTIPRLHPFLKQPAEQPRRPFRARMFAYDFADNPTRNFAKSFTNHIRHKEHNRESNHPAIALPRDFVLYFTKYFVRLYAKYYEFDTSSDLSSDFKNYFSRYLIENVEIFLDQRFAEFFSREFSEIFVRKCRRAFERQFASCAPQTLQERFPDPTAKHFSKEFILREAAKDSQGIREWAGASMARVAGDSFVALMTSVGQPPEERHAYSLRRIQHSGLLNVWPGLDTLLAKHTHPDILALYLALGWTQATTTWQWPATERWIALLSGEPPTEWLPRSQWHLCWLLYDPDDPDHRRGLREALTEGMDDRDHPGIADDLAKLFLDDDG